VEINRWDELQLVQRCKEGSESAFAELVRRHRPRLFTLAYRLTGDRETAEDVVQETFVAAFRALDRFEPRPSLAAWLNTIAVHGASRATTRANAASRTSLDAFGDDGADSALIAAASDANDPHRAAEAAELRNEVAQAIAGLPFKYRAAVVTRYVLGLEYAEAAASLEMGLNTYKSHLLRGTRMLREALAPAAGRQPPAEAIPARLPSSPAGARGGTARHARVPAARGFSDTRRNRFTKEKAIRG
jgi:RNA polymerase sigma-70 factor (ECF subfamily)